jgi:DNA polymerase III alpha subunit
MAATMSADMQNIDKVVTLVDEARRMGLELAPPSVNRSLFRFTGGNGQVIYGLGAVRGVGEGPVASLEAARVEAQRQQIFLSRIAEPNLAVYPLYPRKLTNLASIFIGLAIAYGIGWLLIVGMREHAR